MTELIRIQMRAPTAVNMSGGGVIRFVREGVYDVPREYAEKWCHPRQQLAVLFGEPLNLQGEQNFESGIVFANEVSATEARGKDRVNALANVATEAELRGTTFKATNDTTSYVPDRKDLAPDTKAALNRELAKQIKEVAPV